MVVKQSRIHLGDAGERYFEHQRFAFRYGWDCLTAGVMALVHGIVPAWFETSASQKVKALAERKRK